MVPTCIRVYETLFSFLSTMTHNFKSVKRSQPSGIHLPFLLRGGARVSGLLGGAGLQRALLCGDVAGYAAFRELPSPPCQLCCFVSDIVACIS